MCFRGFGTIRRCTWPILLAHNLVSQIGNIELLSVNVQALAAFQVALKYNSQSSEVSKKIKRLTQLASDKRRAAEVEATRSNVDMKKHLDSLKTELVSLYFLYL